MSKTGEWTYEENQKAIEKMTKRYMDQGFTLKEARKKAIKVARRLESKNKYRNRKRGA